MARKHLLLATFAAFTLLATAGTAFAANSVSAPTSCGYSGYSYAGLIADQSESGISADITTLAQPTITTGHVAAWIGVGGVGLGPNGSTEWLQAGISAVPGEATSLYYELARPNATPVYRLVPLKLQTGRTYQISVQESPTRQGFWSVWVDGVQRAGGIFLPGSHDAWKPMATSESWDGGSPACNAYTFRFSNIRSKTSGTQPWSPMTASVIDAPGYRVEGRTPLGFTAVGGAL